jgi:hypothetical protein
VCVCVPVHCWAAYLAKNSRSPTHALPAAAHLLLRAICESLNGPPRTHCCRAVVSLQVVCSHGRCLPRYYRPNSVDDPAVGSGTTVDKRFFLDYAKESTVVPPPSTSSDEEELK